PLLHRTLELRLKAVGWSWVFNAVVHTYERCRPVEEGRGDGGGDQGVVGGDAAGGLGAHQDGWSKGVAPALRPGRGLRQPDRRRWPPGFRARGSTHAQGLRADPRGAVTRTAYDARVRAAQTARAYELKAGAGRAGLSGRARDRNKETSASMVT